MKPFVTVESGDGSNTAYSNLFQEHYHSTKDGALSETLHKHIIPAFEFTQEKEQIVILDICFGLGYNTLMTLLFRDRNFPEKKVKIFSPEFDKELITSLYDFKYPKELLPYKNVIDELIRNGRYQDKKTEIELYIGDAREYIKKLHKESFDVIYQDAFSPSVNPLLWTKEYFQDISSLMKEDAVLTTYSIALKVRLAMYKNGLHIYLKKSDLHRDSTIASKSKLENCKKIDMEHKISCNKEVMPLLDLNLI